MKNIRLLIVFVLTLVAAKTSFPDENPKVSKLKLQEGFVAEHLFSPSENSMGSWVAMCFDNKDRLIVSDQYGSLYRMKVPPFGNGPVSEVETLKIKGDTLGIGSAHGLLYAFNALYVMVNQRPTVESPRGSGLYKLEDIDQDDEFDKITLIKELNGEGEHGPHSIRLTPDGKSLLVVAGNYTKLPEMDLYRNRNIWDHDNLLSPIKDPRGHANNLLAPGGWVAKLDPDGTNWELIASGFRNAFDMVYNDVGDLFVYDSDMEWDFGLPWYRPTRICHAVSGAEFGWRTGNGKWSPDFADNLPAVINIGQGSPTNLLYLKGAAFPEKYQQSLLAFDWSFGIIHAIHLKPNGATYSAEREEFLSGIPLPLTDGVIGPDGALYFLTGGRRIESDLYRVSYKGNEKTKFTSQTEITEFSKLRRSIERFHKPSNASALEFILPGLIHTDRHVRYASRVALEHQPVESWLKIISEHPSALAKSEGLLALARLNQEKQFWKIVNEMDFKSLTSQTESNVLRAIEIVLSRNKDARLPAPLKETLINQFPSNNTFRDRQLLKILVSQQEPRVLKKALDILENAKDSEQAGGAVATSSADLILRNTHYGSEIAKTLANVPPVEQVYYAVVLSDLKQGWDKKTLKRYFSWYQKAFTYKGGNSYIGFINKARIQALMNVPESKRAYYEKISGGNNISQSGNEIKEEDFPEGPAINWTPEMALEVVKEPLKQRNLNKGRSMFKATTCIWCHQMNGTGGNIGPDLTQAGTRFSQKDLMEAIVYPSKTISDQYAAYQFQLKDGSSIVGSIKNENEVKYDVSLNPYAYDQTVEILKKDIKSKETSKVSSMPVGLINPMNEEELKDLIAYIISAGNQNHPVYK